MKYLKELFRKKYRVPSIHPEFGELSSGRRFRTLYFAEDWARHMNAYTFQHYGYFHTISRAKWTYVVKEI